MLVRVNDLETHYTLRGAGTPVILLHGWGASGDSLGGVARALEDRCRVLAADLPGFGWSAPPLVAWGSREYAAHVDALMERATLPSASVLGHSFGGRVALALAARYPHRVRDLVLVASAGIRPRRGPDYYLKTATAKLAKGCLSLPVFGRVGSRIVSGLSDWAGSRDYRRAGRMRATLVRLVNEDLRDLLSSIRAPTLIIWGDRDRDVPRSSMEIMARRIPGARLEILEGAGHFPFVDVPDRFAHLVREFLCQTQNASGRANRA
ncbi:MAG: alpha/beta fold hydrolase [Candidatus Methylomirabilaceae bacterium]